MAAALSFMVINCFLSKAEPKICHATTKMQSIILITQNLWNIPDKKIKFIAKTATKVHIQHKLEVLQLIKTKLPIYRNYYQSEIRAMS